LKRFRVDVSLICFAFVVIAAVPVTLLRTKTFALGYELGQRKQHERILIQKRDLLARELAAKQKLIRENRGNGFEFPNNDQILRHGEAK
jgi:hypothetical protein